MKQIFSTTIEYYTYDSEEEAITHRNEMSLNGYKALEHQGKRGATNFTKFKKNNYESDNISDYKIYCEDAEMRREK